MAKEDKLGALWVKKGRGAEYMTGEITINGEKTRIVVFFNANKKNEKEPDWHILRSRPQEQQENALPDSGDLDPGDIPF